MPKDLLSLFVLLTESKRGQEWERAEKSASKNDQMCRRVKHETVFPVSDSIIDNCAGI